VTIGDQAWSYNAVHRFSFAMPSARRTDGLRSLLCQWFELEQGWLCLTAAVGILRAFNTAEYSLSCTTAVPRIIFFVRAMQRRETIPVPEKGQQTGDEQPFLGWIKGMRTKQIDLVQTV
jgi:hypothetical protein